jgi:hypothetical protein
LFLEWFQTFRDMSSLVMSDNKNSSLHGNILERRNIWVHHINTIGIINCETKFFIKIWKPRIRRVGSKTDIPNIFI